ncbi:Poly(rC)-binding protein 3 [Wickerhamomyces ciferrii]|uniref:Poly(RC)-binding protein 3 n=1 Tax=Wickerhamomyces ciferrii (strain ATCC 14091 / BCRC 22168 / CBS 111 / JCM 3599 / NBRC 0793 / NRRL Y-1031 F-60-10) TaxID=1206466 RepID=K0KJZ0_WICCF|nr:Poly(rC)-binding protein 3 [Wickerhamomyces ciferrii]CCH42482.1 Poly(rC)-binding protein 3 [Wickerhamomyces ciferrii]
MPPKKRGRPSSKRDSEVPEEQNKRPKTPAAELPPLPSSKGDTYKPGQEKSKEEKEEAVLKLIDSTTYRLNTDTPGQFQLRISISITEGRYLTGPGNYFTSVEGKNIIDKIQKLSNAVLLVTDIVEGSIDREVLVTGGIQEIAIAVAHISTSLASILEDPTTETKLSTTLLIPGSIIESITRAKLTKLITSIDISSVFVPFSNYQTVYIKGRIPQLMLSISTLVKEIANIPIQNQIIKDFPPEPFPLLAVRGDKYVRSETNQKLLDKSKESFIKYLHQDFKEHDKITKTDPKIHSHNQIEEFIKECQKNIKSLDTFKHVIDVPVDSISNVIGHNGLKITEIRSKSNSNVIIDDHPKDTQYKIVTISGLSENNLTALQYLKSLIV